MHWFNTEWIQKADSGEKTDVKHLHFFMNDNPIMGPAEIEKAEAMFSGIFYQRYILGRWVMSEGLIYDQFNPEVHVLQKTPETEGDMFVSSDFGIQNATVFLLWQKERGTDRWICLKEYYYSGRENRQQKTVGQLVDGLKETLPQTDNGPLYPRQVIVDPSAAALIVELRRQGFHVVPAINDVLDGITDTSTLLAQNRLAFTKECKNTIQEFGVYIWDEKAAQHGEDKPIKDNDHSMDAVRYFVKTRHLVKRH